MREIKKWRTIDGKELDIRKMKETHIGNCLLLLEIDLLRQSVIMLGYERNKTVRAIVEDRIDYIQDKMMAFIAELKRRTK